MAAEEEKGRRLHDDMSALQRSLYQKEQEYQSFVQTSQASHPTSTDVDENNRKLDQTLRENLDLQHRLVDC